MLKREARTGVFVLAIALASTAAILLLPVAPSSAQGADFDPVVRCEALSGQVRSDFLIERAEIVGEGPLAGLPSGAPSRGPPTVLPEHCLVRGTINPRIGVGGREFGIGFELRLPAEWNGRFLFQGGGGLDGQVSAAIGNIANSAGPPALALGFAVVSTDSGHTGPIIDATFGLDQQARTDFAYNALDKVSAEAKRLIAAFYGAHPLYSYFLGCSNGGRQALVASQHLPLEFDGIVAGDPAMRFSRLALGEVWNMQVVARIAPRDEAGRPIYSKAFSEDDLKLVRKAVLDRCDALDGLADGMINDWQSCSFHPRELTCSGHKDARCLTADQVGVLDDLIQGPISSTGEYVYGPFTFDTGIASSAWRGMKLGTSETGEPNSADSSLGLSQFRYLQLTPPDPDWDPLSHYTVDEILERIRYQGGIGDGDNPLLSTFALKGKMIVYNGMSDQGMATGAILDWYEKMIAATGEPGRGAVRFFPIPGMLHCGGGESTDRFEMLDAIMNWVEHDEAPDRILASSDVFEGVSRPLCPYPQVARYTGGAEESADSFACE